MVICMQTGYDLVACGLLSIDDLDVLDCVFWQPAVAARAMWSGFLLQDDKRGLLLFVVEEMNCTVFKFIDFIALLQGALFGIVMLDHDACMLCLACVGACSVGALLDNPDLLMLWFTESACV